MRSLQANALAGGYVDLEYSYVVDNPDGTVFESRGPGRNTAAQNAPGAPDNNARSSAICVMGNFEVDRPAETMLDAVAELVAWGHERGYWPAAITGPHQDAPGTATACSGRYLIDAIPEINRRAAGGGGAADRPTSVGGAMQLCRTSTGRGYWIVADDGGVFAFGDAPFYGSAGGIKLAAPVVGMAAASDDGGYALVADDGGVFCYGDVTYRGGMAGQRLAAPIVGIDLDVDDRGYWLLGADGGVFAFDAPYHGNATEYVTYP